MKPTLIIDTREKLPLVFTPFEHYNIIHQKLYAGDYGFEKNGELVCVFERKSPSDLYGSLIGGHRRFKDECNRAKTKSFDFWLIVECSYFNFINKIFDTNNRCSTPSKTLTKILHTFIIRRGLKVMFCESREEMITFIHNHFMSYIVKYK